MRIRAESAVRSSDAAAIYRVHRAAFGSLQVARLVDQLRVQVEPHISLVAEVDHHVVGHLFFSPISLSGQTEARLCALAPLGVLPEKQRCGIGAALVHAGLAACKRSGFHGVLVSGDADYYGRYGFLPAACFDLRCGDLQTDAAFLGLELQAGYLHALQGTVHYPPAFGRELLWRLANTSRTGPVLSMERSGESSRPAF